MSYSLFELTDGKQFYYDSHNNSIYNNVGELLSLPPPKDLEWYKEEEKNHGVLTKVNNPVAIRILLGQACNYSCNYCMQKDIGNPFERPESFYIDSFIENSNIVENTNGDIQKNNLYYIRTFEQDIDFKMSA